MNTLRLEGTLVALPKNHITEQQLTEGRTTRQRISTPGRPQLNACISKVISPSFDPCYFTDAPRLTECCVNRVFQRKAATPSANAARLRRFGADGRFMGGTFMGASHIGAYPRVLGSRGEPSEQTRRPHPLPPNVGIDRELLVSPRTPNALPTHVF